MEHHWEFNVYSKHARAEILVDTLFFKHKYLTSPIVAPEDTVVEVTSNSNSTKSEQMELLKQLGKVFNKIAEKNSQEGANKQPKNNGIKTYNKETQPSADVTQPRVKINTP